MRNFAILFSSGPEPSYTTVTPETVLQPTISGQPPEADADQACGQTSIGDYSYHAHSN